MPEKLTLHYSKALQKGQFWANPLWHFCLELRTFSIIRMIQDKTAYLYHLAFTLQILILVSFKLFLESLVSLTSHEPLQPTKGP